MNANEISPKANTRLNRIKTVSRIAKFVMLVFLYFSVLLFMICLVPLPELFHRSSAAPRFDPLLLCRGLVTLGYQIMLCLWCWKLERLFSYYERGLIFAAQTIRCIKRLGLICVAGAVLKSTMHFLPKLPLLPPQTSLPAGVTITKFQTFQIGFFSFDFGTGVDIGLIFSGIIIVLIAWIMDEGRKIQEEQELTV